jgi:hypothetical protein
MRSIYTPEHQKLLGCKTKPEPWLHIVTKSYDRKPTTDQATTTYAIYVWDTRQVIEEGEVIINLVHPLDTMYPRLQSIRKRCHDSLEPLKGSKHFTKSFQLETDYYN